ncbi:MAG TPA: DUF11 domain-containing protein [Methanoregula sp.]|nr:DUF11 domain-containing protein [Methanoregula sp.]
MTRFIHALSGIVLLALLFNIGIVSAADFEEKQADLNVSKLVSSTGPYEIDDEVTWAITLRNNGPGNATNITLQEDNSRLYGLKNVTAVAGLGVYNTTTHVWSIDELLNGTYATLTLKTTFNTSGNKTNKVNITAFDGTDPVLTDNHAEAMVQYNTSQTINPDTPSSGNLVIRPTTLNLKSKGIFTVYVSLYGSSGKRLTDDKNQAPIDYANSSLTCSGAEMIRASVSNKDGGTLIAKFHRDDLENITSGEGVKINCSGTLVVNNNTINVEGSDTIRVIGEKNDLDKILSRLWKFLGLAKEDVEITEDENGNINLTISLNPEDFKKFSQVKKSLKTHENATDPGDITAFKNENKNVKEQSENNNGSNKQIKSQSKENNADDNKENGNNKENKGNHNTNARDDESSGKSNGKKNT